VRIAYYLEGNLHNTRVERAASSFPDDSQALATRSVQYKEDHMFATSKCFFLFFYVLVRLRQATDEGQAENPGLRRPKPSWLRLNVLMNLHLYVKIIYLVLVFFHSLVPGRVNRIQIV